MGLPISTVHLNDWNCKEHILDRFKIMSGSYKTGRPDKSGVFVQLFEK